MRMKFTIKILGIILSSLILVSKSHDDTDCQPGTAMRSIFEQNCAGLGWVEVSDPNLVSGSCKKRKSFVCMPVQGSKSNRVDDGHPKKGPDCKTVYVQECNSHGGPTKCVVVPKQKCDQPAEPKESGLNYKSGSGREGNNFFIGGGFNDEDSTSGGILKGNAGSCSTRVNYLTQCREDRDPRCAVVPVPETDCSEDEDHDEESDDRFNVEDLVVKTLKARKDDLESGTCQLVNVRKCHRDSCGVIQQKVCKGDSEADGMDHHDEHGKTARPKTSSQSDKQDIKDSSDHFKGIGNDKDLGINDFEGLQHFEPSIEYVEDEPKTGKSGCKMVESCKTVPKRVCGKESEDDVYCKESSMEDCGVSVENTTTELCHFAVEKICKPASQLQSGGVGEYGEKVVCKEADVYMCSTEYEVETVSGVRSSCIQVPRVRCNAIPDHYGYKKHSKSCVRVRERICRKFNVVEPQPKANSHCGYKKVKSCYYEGGNPAKSSDLVECKDTGKNLCGKRVTKELVPDVCSIDVYPHCQYAEEKHLGGCRNVMKEECRMIEKC